MIKLANFCEDNSLMTRKWWGLIALVLIPLTLGQGCSLLPFWGDDEKETFDDENTTEQVLYREAQRQLRSGNYTQAIGTLQRVEARFPFGR
jgi:outer membrane protein assembly factor BamD (BamD/ComL family)